MLFTGLATLYIQARKNRDDAASHLTSGALELIDPLRQRNKELEDTIKKYQLYVAYLRDGIRQLTQYIVEQSRAIPWLPLDWDDFEKQEQKKD